MKRTPDAALAVAMFALAHDMQSDDGVANAAIREAGMRIHQIAKERAEIIGFLKRMPKVNNRTYVGKDIISYGEQASKLIAKLEAA